MNEIVRVLVEHYDLLAPGKFAGRNSIFVHGSIPAMLVFDAESVIVGRLSQAEHTLFRNKGVAWMPVGALINKVMRTPK